MYWLPEKWCPRKLLSSCPLHIAVLVVKVSTCPSVLEPGVPAPTVLPVPPPRVPQGPHELTAGFMPVPAPELQPSWHGA